MSNLEKIEKHFDIIVSEPAEYRMADQLFYFIKKKIKRSKLRKISY